ncbi:MAG: PAS domain-containing sensor histidine kinase [Gemmatimonadetes bacterium]|nr:PAS domain-containing sensor histidine kinase [Gemmatimonadota bacterium]
MIFTTSPHPIVYMVVLAAVFAYLYWQYRQLHFLPWVLAWILLLAVHLDLSGSAERLGPVEAGLVTAAAALMVAGGVMLAGWKRLGLLGGLAFGASLAIVTALAHLGVVAALPARDGAEAAALAFLAAGWIGTGWLIVRYGRATAPIGARVAGFSLGSWGALQPVGWIVAGRQVGEAWLIQLDAGLGALLAVGMVILGLEESRARVVRDLAYARDVLDDDPNLIVVLAAGRFVFANRALLDRTGWSLDEIGRYEPLDLVVPEDRERVARALADRTAGQPVPDYEMEILGAGGERIPVIVHADPILWEGAHAFKYELTDVSTRVRAEEETREVNAELQRVNAELQKSNELKNEFLSNTSHELKTPLTSIIANTEILEYEMCGPLNEEQRQILGTIGRNSQHLLEMISRLLDFARREEGHDLLQYEQVEIRTLIEGVVRTLDPLLEEGSLEISIDLQEDLGPCWLDGEKIYRIFLNLVENAIKFSNEGTITIAARRTDDELEGRVTDEGIGVPAERVVDIFHAFRQVDASATRPYQGVGLGLAICKQLVELHGGRIWVESRPGEGSSFRFRIPWRDAPPVGVVARREGIIGWGNEPPGGIPPVTG